MAYFRCKDPFAYWVDGEPFVVSGGDIVTSDKDPRYVGHEVHFETVEENAARSKKALNRRTGVVEAATAAPGEKRSLPPRRAGGK